MADEIGFANLTGAALAHRLKVKPASLYSHVSSFEGLKTGIALHALKEIASRSSEALAGRAGKAALIALADVYRDYGREHPGRFEVARHPLSPEHATPSAGLAISKIMRAALRQYDLSDVEQVRAVRLLGGFLMGFVTLELSDGFSHSIPDSQASWSRSLEAIDVMLRHWPVK